KVRDLGKGIPKELQERLFVPKRSGKDQGAGIGLVIAAQLARQIGGELRLEETGLTGTCFSMTMSA
ncbi:MAG: sensor histidine kinase, partial [Verrucomicrobiales bacterium]